MSKPTPNKCRPALAERFREVAKKRGDSLTTLADQFGVSRYTLYRVLQGETSRPTVEKITAYVQEAA